MFKLMDKKRITLLSNKFHLVSRPMSCFFLLQSPYFASMFSGSWKESSMKKVEMDIVDENIDEDCKYMYSHFCIEKQIQLTLIH